MSLTVRGLFSLLRILRIRGIASMLLNLPKYLRLSWRLLFDPRVPGLPKLFVLIAAVYGLMPFDLIPEGILPHIGLWEDLVLVIITLRNLIASSPPDVVTEHARSIALKPRPKS